MKSLKKTWTTLAILTLSSIVIYSCSKSFLDKPPVAQLSEVTLQTKSGINGLLVGAYSMIDGTGLDNWFIDTKETTAWNPWAGSAAADDSHKGGGYTSQTYRSEIENHTANSTNTVLDSKWKFTYAAVQRSNDVLRNLAIVPAGIVTEAEALQLTAESRFLRGVYHFDAAKMWRNIPFVDETISVSNANYKVVNTISAWPKIEADLQFAITNLPATQADLGRGTSWAAKAFLVKVYLQQGKLAEAKPILDDLISNGVTSSGAKYDLLPEFSQLWRAQYENGPESVFSAQISVNDNSDGKNSNDGETSNYPGPLGGWGNQPSFNLVNAYKTENGYPMFGTFNDVDVTNDMGQDPVVTPVFIPYAGTVDPRLDWTIGRRELPFHDYGPHREKYNFMGGPYRGKKWVPWFADNKGKDGEVRGGTRYSGNNFCLIRFADVLLWAAEVEVEIGDLQKAEGYVNRIRTRAGNTAGFLHTYVDDANPALGFTSTPAANYDIKPYGGADGFVAKGKDYAREAVRFERRLELALEGHRFFDLQRYDLAQPGYMSGLLNTYIPAEVQKWEFYLPGLTYDILKGAIFTQGKNEIYAIPQSQIDQSNTNAGPTLKQNPGF